MTPLFERIYADEFDVILSSLTQDELSGAPERVKNMIIELKPANTQLVKSPEETFHLAQAYLDEGIVGKTSFADCLHIATATFYGADLLISWNFRHIVNDDRTRQYNLINFREGYR